MPGQIVFLVIAAPFFGLWAYFGARYVSPSRRWFLRYMEREVSSAERQTGFDSWLARRLPRRPLLWRYVAYAWVRMLTGHWAPWAMFRTMFRSDADPEIERLRQEAVARYRPLLVMFSIFVCVWAVAVIVALLVLLVHYLVT